jgi:hypothetical protein
VIANVTIKDFYLNFSSFLLAVGRRRRDSSLLLSPLTRALRRKRQGISGGGTIYNLPTTYTINLPVSCCKSGGTTIVNSLGGCEYLHLHL